MINCCVATDDLCINQGATYTRAWIWEVSQCCNTGTAGAAPAPMDLTGYTASMQIRPFPLSTALLYDASADIVLGGITGTVTLTIDAQDTEGFTWWAGVYDLLLTNPATGVTTRFLEGTVEVSPGVTSPAFGMQVLNDAGVAVQNDAGLQVNTSS